MHAPPLLAPWRQPLLPFAGAMLGAWLALTPSLLPRAALMQGVLCAVAAMLGYGVGSFAHWITTASGLRVRPKLRRQLRRAFGVLSIALSVIALWISYLWQQQQRAELGMQASNLVDVPIISGVAVLLFAVLLVIARSMRAAGRWVVQRLDRWLPRTVAMVLGTLLVGGFAIWFINDLAVGKVASALDRSFLSANDEFIEDIAPPTSQWLSAGPGSAVSWEQLGRQGRIFIANAPTAEQVGEFLATRGSDERTSQPIRVYVGGGTDGVLELRAQAELAVAELERTGAFDRAVLNVATGTGRGWVNENQARALELMWAGDTATVSMQYSYLPSWMSYLVDSQRAREAGRALFEAVYERWSALPSDDRPLLVVSGESLGSFGSEGAFSGVQDVASRTDGALYVGPTANNELWAQVTADRDPGTPVYLPSFHSGETVRFSADGVAWNGQALWSAPRVGYLQHANDPVTWLDFGIALSPPEWLRGERGPGVPDEMIWIPVVTALQLGIDQLATGVPDGQGHEFGQAPAHAWAQILPPEGWSEADTRLLADELEQLRAFDIDVTSSS